VVTRLARDHIKALSTKLKAQLLYDLERKERFELSIRVWKTRGFPATDTSALGFAMANCQLGNVGTPGRIRTCNLDVRSVARFQLRYRSRRISDCGFRIVDLNAGAVDISRREPVQSHSKISNPKSKLEHRTGFEPVSQRWQRRVLNRLDQRCRGISKWSGRTELNCRHECPKLGCLRYTTPRKISFEFRVQVRTERT
jgi:hypothetical protein